MPAYAPGGVCAMFPDEEKQRLRQQARAARSTAHDASAELAALAVADSIKDVFKLAGIAVSETVLAGYWPMGSELDIRPALQSLHDAGAVCALPVVVSPDQPLVFRRWQPGTPLSDGGHGTRQPGPEQTEVLPRVVLLPLLAFDDGGMRLGQGQGYYDRTLAALRGKGPVLAVGIAYQAQKLKTLPADEWDQRLNWVVTEQGATAYDR